jgi:hypothetical protein
MEIIFQERRGEEKVRKLQLLTFENQLNELKLCNTEKTNCPSENMTITSTYGRNQGPMWNIRWEGREFFQEEKNNLVIIAELERHILRFSWTCATPCQFNLTLVSKVKCDIRSQR